MVVVGVLVVLAALKPLFDLHVDVLSVEIVDDIVYMFALQGNGVVTPFA
jgi:hypothetical protein